MRFLMLAMMLALAVGCTENERARVYGGSMTIPLPCGQRLATATWKGADLWYLTRPMEATDEPVTSVFHEASQFGIANGTVTFFECKEPTK